MQIQHLARTSTAIAATRSRRKKTAMLAECLAALSPDEVYAATSYLTGALPQGRIGIGPSAVRAAAAEPNAQATLTVSDVDAALNAIAACHGAGAQRSRAQALRDLLARATAEEQRFLRQLLLGELRQGALDGVVSDVGGPVSFDVVRVFDGVLEGTEPEDTAVFMRRVAELKRAVDAASQAVSLGFDRIAILEAALLGLGGG